MLSNPPRKFDTACAHGMYENFKAMPVSASVKKLRSIPRVGEALSEVIEEGVAELGYDIVNTLGTDASSIDTEAVQGFGFSKVLQPSDGLLHFGLEILYADACAAQSPVLQNLQYRIRDLGRVDFDRELEVLGRREAGENRFAKLVHQIRVKQRRRAATKMQPRHPDALRQALPNHVNFFDECLDIRGQGRQRLRPLCPAGTEIAKPPAEGDMNVDRDRFVCSDAIKPVRLVPAACVEFESVRRRIAGEPRHSGAEQTILLERGFIFHGIGVRCNWEQLL